MFSIHDPLELAAIATGILGTSICTIAAILLSRKRLGALINNLLIRPVYLVKLKLKNTYEWERHRHSPEHIAAYRQSLIEIEQWLHEQEPELEVVG